jgi:SAM-dependent methyltransferase
MSNRHFPDIFIDELYNIDPNHNYFTPVWDSVFDTGLRPQKILDIGCGNGVFGAYAFHRVGSRLYGVDGSAYALSQAQKNFYHELKHVDDFSTDRVDYEDGTFDFCLCKDLLEHLIHPAMVMAEAFRLISCRGHFLLHVPYHFPLYGRLKFLIHNNIDTFGYFPYSRLWEYPHIRFFTRESLLQLALQSGFSLKVDLSYHFPALPGMGIIPFGNRIGMELARHSPSQFAQGFTFLLQKQ